MEPLTKKYVEAHLKHLYYLKCESRFEEVFEYDSLYDHMYVFLLSLGLSPEEAGRIIGDFRGK